MGVQERVDIVVNADTYNVQKLFADLHASFSKVGISGAQAGEKVATGWGRAGAEVGRFALGMAGANSITQVLSSAVGRLNAEWDNFIQRAEKAAGAQTTFADAERRMANVLGDMPRSQASQRVLGISRSTGVGPSQVAMAATSALSGKGETIPDVAAFNAVREAAKYLPGPRTQSDELSGLASTILMMQKDDPNLSAKQAMSFISNVQRSDRSESIQDLSKYLLPSIITSKGFGAGGADDLKFIASMGTAIGSRSEDSTGEMSATALQALSRQVKLWTLPHVGQNATVRQQWDFLMNNPAGRKIRQEKLGGLMKGDDAVLGGEVDLKVGKGRMMIPLSELLQDGDNVTKRMMAASMGAIFTPGSAQSVAAFDQLQGQNASVPIQQVAALEQSLSGTSAGMMLPNTVLGTRGQLRSQLPDILQQAGVSDTVKKMVMAKFDAQSAMASDRAGVIEAGQSALAAGLSPETSQVGWAAGGAGGSVTVQNKLTAEQLETNKLIRELIDKLGAQKLTVEDTDGNASRGAISAERGGRN